MAHAQLVAEAAVVIVIVPNPSAVPLPGDGRAVIVDRTAVLTDHGAVVKAAAPADERGLLPRLDVDAQLAEGRLLPLGERRALDAQGNQRNVAVHDGLLSGDGHAVCLRARVRPGGDGREAALLRLAARCLRRGESALKAPRPAAEIGRGRHRPEQQNRCQNGKKGFAKRFVSHGIASCFPFGHPPEQRVRQLLFFLFGNVKRVHGRHVVIQPSLFHARSPSCASSVKRSFSFFRPRERAAAMLLSLFESSAAISRMEYPS